MNILRRITKQVVHTITVHAYIYHGNLPNKLAATLTYYINHWPVYITPSAHQIFNTANKLYDVLVYTTKYTVLDIQKLTHYFNY